MATPAGSGARPGRDSQGLHDFAGQGLGTGHAGHQHVLDWRRLGTALGAAKLPPKKKPDTVAAWVTLSAVKHGSAVVFTSDPGDIEAYLALMHPVDVHIVPV
ncbi:hypothetical protein ACIRVK_03025 [Streptomyces sp. NPDC101152]|uniref:hypothetical protein n=1 Tax=Streptomyces sp. NPDC101152 TaxID=3366116 RepID=UPI0038286532